MKKKASPQAEEPSVLTVEPLEFGIAEFCVLGTAPMIQNRMAQKARMELLFPRGRLTQSDKATKMKHAPLEEFRSAAYAPPDKDYATRLIVPARAFGKVLANAALDTPGAAKAQVLRLTTILAEDGVNVPVYGIPQLYMAVVRMADQKKTPDIRSRPILAEWACFVRVRYIKPTLTAQTVGNLFARGGMVFGIGDDRHEKGGLCGFFELVSSDDERFVYLVKNCGKAAQDKALAEPTCYDAETEELYSWYRTEVVRRERKSEESAQVFKGARNSRRAKSLEEA